MTGGWLDTCWICLQVDVLDEDGLCPQCSIRGNDEEGEEE